MSTLSAVLDPASEDGRRLVRRMAGAFARARPRDPLCEADDLEQEAALALLRYLPADRPTLARRIVRQAFAAAWLRAVRERAGEAAAMESASWAAPSPGLDPGEAADVRSALAALPGREAALVVGRYAGGETFRELGARHGRSEDWARKSVEGSRRKLAAALGAAYAEDCSRRVARRGTARREESTRYRPGRARKPAAGADPGRFAPAKRARKAKLAAMAAERGAKLSRPASPHLQGACA